MNKKFKLDKEEQEILESVENGEWISIPNVKTKIKKYADYARNTLKKDKRLNIRMSGVDLEMIQRKAIEEGIPYQTLISSLLHKYVSGRLIESRV